MRSRVNSAAKDEVVKAAYNNPAGRPETLYRYLALQPDGAFIAQEDGRIVGFGGAINYATFGYIGLMSVHPAMQRRGAVTNYRFSVLPGDL
ncbi:MAG TPA: GNAT family N-acetyltransferase [Ktedonobacteraceae bacterium]|nr:GNAT family N-acetyltransferase [Ktedonobacteraceae bacterium]